jgi:hypothetical protein
MKKLTVAYYFWWSVLLQHECYYYDVFPFLCFLHQPNHEDKDDIEEVYDSGDYFKPSNDDCNSGDSNLSFPSSESNKSDDISYIKEKKKKNDFKNIPGKSNQL